MEYGSGSALQSGKPFIRADSAYPVNNPFHNALSTAQNGHFMKRIIALAGITLLASCITITPGRYSTLVDNQQALKKYAGSQARVTAMLTPVNYSGSCRLVTGKILGPDGMSIAQYVQRAFNDELKTANIYSDSGVSFVGSLTEINFSSGHGGILASGWWDLSLSLNSGNGKSIKVANRYEFESSLDRHVACDRTARALTPAVQDLINKAVTDPQFGNLLRQTRAD